MGEALRATLDGLGAEYRTKPGTPMIGECSINQMDDFYAALALGQVKPSGIMNYIQHLFVAERCPPGAKVVDVCCGRGLQLPVLYRYAPHIYSYVGLDIARGNLEEAKERIEGLNRHDGRPFEVSLIECDVAQAWPQLPPFDIAVYTSALEHFPREKGVASLRHTAAALARGGRLYLSTPNTSGDPPRKLQYHVHVYEWHIDELSAVLAETGLVIEEIIGLLPPPPQELATALASRFGDGAARWYERLRQLVPAPFLDTIAASAIPESAAELLYVCSRRSR
ncbi:MAG: class I SAM-dependent methyltransferase [Pseudonocardiaceae bacterium]